MNSFILSISSLLYGYTCFGCSVEMGGLVLMGGVDTEGDGISPVGPSPVGVGVEISSCVPSIPSGVYVIFCN